MSDTPNTGTPPTEAQLKERRAALNKFYGEQIPLLKKQAEYEDLLTKIEVSKMTRLEIALAKMELQNEPRKEHKDPQGQPPGKPEEHVRPVNQDLESKESKLKVEK